MENTLKNHTEPRVSDSSRRWTSRFHLLNDFKNINVFKEENISHSLRSIVYFSGNWMTLSASDGIVNLSRDLEYWTFNTISVKSSSIYTCGIDNILSYIAKSVVTYQFILRIRTLVPWKTSKIILTSCEWVSIPVSQYEEANIKIWSRNVYNYFSLSIKVVPAIIDLNIRAENLFTMLL